MPSLLHSIPVGVNGEGREGGREEGKGVGEEKMRDWLHVKGAKLTSQQPSRCQRGRW